MNFIYSLRDEVKLVFSGEHGMIVGRAEFTDSQPQYLVRYKAADGRQVENWWNEAAIAR